VREHEVYLENYQRLIGKNQNIYCWKIDSLSVTYECSIDKKYSIWKETFKIGCLIV
jgi:hypothetical protein